MFAVSDQTSLNHRLTRSCRSSLAFMIGYALTPDTLLPYFFEFFYAKVFVVALLVSNVQ